MSQRDQNPIDLEEWDFSAVPNDQVENCWWYEYARELPNVIKSVERLRRAQLPPNGKKTSAEQFEEILSAAWRKSMLGILSICPEFPGAPWLRIPAGERRSRTETLRSDGIAGREPGFGVLDPSKIRVRIEALIKISDAKKAWNAMPTSAAAGQNNPKALEPLWWNELGYTDLHDSIPEGCGLRQDIFCEIDWSKSNEQLLKDFSDWLSKSRPPMRRPKDRSIRTKRESLKALSALRLFRYSRSLTNYRNKQKAASAALEFSQKFGSDAIYESNNAFLEAAQNAEAQIKELTQT